MQCWSSFAVFKRAATCWSILIQFMYSHLYLGLSRDLFLQDFPPKTCMCFSSLLPHLCYIPSHFIFLHLIIKIIFFSISCFFPPCYAQIFSPYPVLEYLQLPLFPSCERPSFTSKQNNRPNYSSLYFNLYVFRQWMGRQRTLDRMVTGISWIWADLNFYIYIILNCYCCSKYLNSALLSMIYYLFVFSNFVLHSFYIIVKWGCCH